MRRIGGLAVAMVLASSGVAAAQGSDSTAARPARLPFLDAPSLLTGQVGVWVHDFGTPGWPDGVSLAGVDPGRSGLTLDDMPFDDPVTGRPDYAMLPFDKLESVRRAPLSAGRSDGIAARLSPFSTPRPLTELVYRSTGTGLQQVSVVHAQTRGANRPTRYVFGYGGAGSTGEYPGSSLSRKRQVMGLVSRSGSLGELEVGQMFNRHRVGAHGGVQTVSGFGYDSIYQRFGATVEGDGDRRQTSRNDLWVGGMLRESRTRARLWWTQGTLTWRSGTDTTAARVSRLGVLVRQPLLVAGRSAEVQVDAWRDTYPSRNGWVLSPEPGSHARAMLAATANAGNGDVEASFGFQLAGGGPSAAGAVWSVKAGYRIGPANLNAFSRSGLSSPSASDLFGFGPTAPGNPDLRTGRTTTNGADARTALGPVDLRISLLQTRIVDAPLRELDQSGDTLRVTTRNGTASRSMGVLRLGFRDQSTRGLYASAQGTLTQTAGVGSESDESIPGVFAAATFGIRGILFRNDLDGDLAVRARTWSAHTGLRFHPETGLLARSYETSQQVPASMILDLVGIAHVRTATITVSLENFLSGTTITPGNQLIPDYPYPERRLRLSVFWPIND